MNTHANFIFLKCLKTCFHMSNQFGVLNILFRIIWIIAK